MPRSSRPGGETPISGLPGSGPETPAGDHRRLAELIVDGRLPFPPGLAGPDRDRVAALVREHLRVRLVGFIARVIAQDVLAARSSFED
ncbi:MAG: hypothetical protein JWO38_4641 [Gemmataceae bacterium]|nr:hypothetical protein [Gemmataceae bacterium]